MALSLAGILARMGRDAGLLLLGLTDDAARTDVVTDAVNNFGRSMDRPIIAANLSVTAGLKGPYDIPATIDKLKDVRNEANKGVVYSHDELKAEITLQDEPASDATYSIYGTTKDTRTNLAAIVAAIDENTEDVLYAFVEAAGLRWAKEETADNKQEYAKKLARDEKKRRNRSINFDYAQKLYLDQQGRNISHPGAADGINAGISDLFEQDLE